MRLVFSQYAWEDYVFWQQTDRRMLERINQLIRDIERCPNRGIGKPEPLRGDLSGYWSRRTDNEHRIVYRIFGDDLLIVLVRYHY